MGLGAKPLEMIALPSPRWTFPMFDRRLLFLLAVLFLPAGIQPASATTKAGAIQHVRVLGEQAFGALRRSNIPLEEREVILAVAVDDVKKAKKILE